MVLAILISVNYGVLCEVTAPQPQQSAELAGQPASPPSSAPLLTSLLHLSRRLAFNVTDVKKKLSSIKLPFLKAVACTPSEHKGHMPACGAHPRPLCPRCSVRGCSRPICSGPRYAPLMPSIGRRSLPQSTFRQPHFGHRESYQ